MTTLLQSRRLFTLFSRLAFGLFAIAGVRGLAPGAEAIPPAGHPFLSPIFTDNMVLQRGKPNVLWGWTEPGREVAVSVGGFAAKAVADASGKWRAAVSVPKPGGPYEVTVEGPERVVLHNVLVGDVWLCGGQSNMEFALKQSARGPEEALSASHDELRLYRSGQQIGYSPLSTPRGHWEVCSPKSAAEFSAVGYYFGRRLQGTLAIPIGLIEASVGGSPAQSWMSAQVLQRLGEFGAETAEIHRLDGLPEPRHGSFLMHWLDENDPGGRNNAWAAEDLDDGEWKSVRVPEGFAHRDAAGGAQVWWLRREFTLGGPLAPGASRVFLGEVGKMDTTFINGHWVGASSWVENPRAYAIPEGVLRTGRNVLAVRVFIRRRDGGFLSNAESLRIQLADGTVVPLSGEWKDRMSADAPPSRPQPLDVENYPTMPTVLYNGMIAPLAPLAITGAIWYQGEANAEHPVQYRRLLPALIAGWRSEFHQGDFPFYIVGLPAFMQRRPEPGSDGWAELREAQALTVRTTPNTGLAVTIDTGEADNIHPREKKVVGDRLAWCALASHYKIDVPHSGPRFDSLRPLAGALQLHFSDVAAGLVVRGDHLGGFAVAGADHVWHWADARIDHDEVIVSSRDVASPVAVRYAWQANPEAALFNTNGFPAAPFRSDDWPAGN